VIKIVRHSGIGLYLRYKFIKPISNGRMDKSAKASSNCTLVFWMLSAFSETKTEVMEDAHRTTTTPPPVRIQVASDLHLEFYGSDQQPPLPDFSEILTPSAPTLALVGDISVLSGDVPRANYRQLLRWCVGGDAPRFQQVLIVLGNHEFYSAVEKGKRQSAAEVDGALKALAKAVAPPPRIIVLDGATAATTIVGGLRVAGATLWAHMPSKAMLDVAGVESPEYLFNDYRRIFVGEGNGRRDGEEGGEGQRLDHSSTTMRANGDGVICARNSSDCSDGSDGGEGGGGAEGGAARADGAAVTTRESACGSTRRLERPGLVALEGKHTNAWHSEDVAFIRAQAREASRVGENLLVLTHHAPSTVGTMSAADLHGPVIICLILCSSPVIFFR
jgi:hypothetical protein